MGQRSDADPIDAGLGQSSHRKKTYTTGGLELNPRRGDITPSDGLSDLLGRKVVNQDDIGKALERAIELLEGINFDLDGCAWRSGSSRRGYRGCERIRAGSSGGFIHPIKMIVFDKNRVIKSESVIAAATASNCIFLKKTPARRRLARVEDHRARALDRRDVARGQGGDSA